MTKITKILAGVISLMFLFSCAAPGDGGSTGEPTAPATDISTGTVSQSETEPSGVEGAEMVRGFYLGVENYGSPETVKENIPNFRYVFEVAGEEVSYPVAADKNYTVQNALKRGSDFELTLADGVITAARDVTKDPYVYFPPISGEPGVRTVRNLIKTALGPVGRTLYVYGGGWNWQDDGSSTAATSVGLFSDWAWQFDIMGADYEYDAADPTVSYFPNGGFNEYWNAGLDCSGYLGWCVYNALNTENGGEGYVTASTLFASSLADRGLGTVTAGTPVPTLENYRPGDIVSIKGHVFMIIGVCADGSVVIAHSTVTESRTGHKGGGVQISAVGRTKACEAYAVADRFMTENYPEWNGRYETDLKDPSVYFPGESGSVFTWSESVLSDPDGIRSMLPDRVLEAAKG
ncbi:MAG: hypothetical protein IKN50_07270 [Clostridia bacterium]|nr:hypothetical protein [Clostridia bacterium]